MPIPLKIPNVGESVSEVQIGEWLKKTGEPVKRDEAVAQLESDKATVDLYAPEGGTLGQILKQKGESAQIGEIVGYLDEAREAPRTASKRMRAPAMAAPFRARPPEAPPEHAPAPPPIPEAPPAPPAPPARQERVEVAPLPPAQAPETAPAAGEDVVPMSPLRRRLAERLVEAQNTMALLTTFNEIDMSAVQALRQRHRDAFQAKHGTKLGLMSFFVKAVVEALKRIPQVNSEIRGEAIVYHHRYDIGIAVGGGRGLVVPVLRQAEQLGFARIEKTIADFAKRAQENKLTIAELQGGTFTISNGGVYGSLLSTPLVNAPQSAILGMHAIGDRPVAREGQVVIRPMMYVALTYDHRVIDGREAVLFLRAIRESLEDPARLLLEV